MCLQEVFRKQEFAIMPSKISNLQYILAATFQECKLVFLQKSWQLKLADKQI